MTGNGEGPSTIQVQSLRGRILKGWMDSGLGSNNSGTRSGLGEISERSEDIGEASSDTIEAEQLYINQERMTQDNNIV